MGQREGIDSSKACPRTPPGHMEGLSLYLKPNPILVAVSLTLILMTSGFVYYWMLPLPPGDDGELTPHAAIYIDGDANFTATALLEGWPGDGSPENPFIIEWLYIDLGDGEGHCIMISNTRVSFTISNCNLTGANNAAYRETIFWQPMDESPPREQMNKGAGIHLHNVSNGELVSNNCTNNSIGIDLFYADSNTVSSNNCTNNGHGIVLWGSYSNTVTNNTCSSNTEGGISLYVSKHNTLTNNTCTNNRIGIYLYTYGAGWRPDHYPSQGGYSNTIANNTCNNNSIGIDLLYAEFFTIANNTCNNNDIGINLEKSHSNTVSDNTCNNNRIGIYLDDRSESNTMENNTFSGNTEHDTVHEYELKELAHQEYMAEQSVWFLAGAGMILVTSVVAFVKFRRMGI